MLHEEVPPWVDEVFAEAAAAGFGSDYSMSEEDRRKADAIKAAQTDLLKLAGRGTVLDEWISFETATALLRKEFPPTPWAVQGLLTSTGVFAIAGEPKTTKTWAALELGMAIATATPAFGEFRAVGQPRPVVFFMAEDTAQSARNRIRALAKGRGIDLDATGLGDNIHVRSLGRLNLTSPRDVARLLAGVRDIGKIGALFLDPLVNLHTAEENSAKEMTQVMGALRNLRDILECPVPFVHHSTKASEQSKGRRPGQRMRGSGSIHGAVDGGIYLSDLDTDGQVKWTNTAHVELKAAKGAGAFRLTLEVEDEGDEAVCARWTHKSVAGAAAVKDETKVFDILAAMDAEQPGEFWPQADIAKRVGIRNEKTGTLLYGLAGDRLIERGMRGGWRVRK